MTALELSNEAIDAQLRDGPPQQEEPLEELPAFFWQQQR
jgi:hypothetical protein